MLVLQVLFFLIAGYYAFCAAYTFLFSVAGLFYKNPVFPQAKKYRSIAILVPAYKAGEVIEELARNVLLQDYPDFDVIIIADSIEQDVLDRLKLMPVKVMEFADENRTKALALNTIMAKLPDYDIALVLDSDNLIKDPYYLHRINDAVEAGCQVVQTHRTSKNQNTSLAYLDAISEEMNNHIFRRGHVAASLSSALIGSAMAFDYRLFKGEMKNVTTSGEDRELEMKLLKRGIRFYYIDNLLVLDEKTQKASAFVNQRARWIANQMLQARDNIGDGIKLLFRGNIDFFDKVIQQFLLPRILMLASLTVFALLSVFLPWPYAVIFPSVAGIFYLSLILSIPVKMYNKLFFKSLLYLPAGAFLMVRSLFKIKGATKKFHATEHGVVSGEPSIK